MSWPVKFSLTYFLVAGAMPSVLFCCLFFELQQPSRPNLRPLRYGSVYSLQAKTMVVAGAQQSIVIEGKSMLIPRKTITLVPPDCGIPKKKGQLPGSLVEQFSVRLMEKMLAELLTFYCLVTWGMQQSSLV